MEPKIPSPEAAPSLPPQPQEYQRGPEQPVPNPEVPVYSPERTAERVGEQHHAVTATPTPVPAISLPTPVLPQQDDTAMPTAADDTPLSARDDDLIEKEWVDKAKKVVVETKDDPHMREREVGKLQVDYLRKRYGRELGEAS